MVVSASSPPGVHCWWLWACGPGRNGPGARRARAAQPKWGDDAVVDLRGPVVAAHRFDHHAGQDVVGVDVGPGLPGRRVAHGHRDELVRSRRSPAVAAVSVGRGEVRVDVQRVVVEAAGLLQKPADGDGATVVAVAGDDAGQPAFHRVGQLELVLGCQLEDHGGHEGFGDAGGAQVRVGRDRAGCAHLRHAAASRPGAGGGVQAGQYTGDAQGVQGVGVALEAVGRMSRSAGRQNYPQGDQHGTELGFAPHAFERAGNGLRRRWGRPRERSWGRPYPGVSSGPA